MPRSEIPIVSIKTRTAPLRRTYGGRSLGITPRVLYDLKTGFLPPWMTTSESGGFENGLTIYGTNGRLTLGDPNEYGVPLTLTNKLGGPIELPMTHAYGNGNFRCIGVAEMAYAIRAGRVPRTEEMPVHVLEAAQGIWSSGEAGTFYKMTTKCSRPAPLPAGYTENPELSLR